MLTTNTPLLARLAENHTQMIMAHNQLAEAHKMLISQLVAHTEHDPSDPNEPTRANKPKPFTPDVKPQPVVPSAMVEPQEVIEPKITIEVPASAEDKPATVVAEKKVQAPKAEAKPAKAVKPIVETPKVAPEPEPKPEPVDIESLDLRHVVALSVLFGDKALKPDSTQVAKATATLASEKADSVTGQIDALYCALNGLPKVTFLPKAKIFTICLKTLANWDNLFGITDRREFALSLVRELPTPAEVKLVEAEDPRTKSSKLITELAKKGYRNEVVKILHEFNAKRLGDIPDDNLVQFIKKAQRVLADDNAEGSDG
ncbi:hypothetical protein QE197_10205 [Arsenophonus nasoniae]|uniref:Uncharacterized protein n=1 Tax=Arsenophonus nasoniae TaxID=638 RepID=A0A4V1BWY7_9GAMM|nr:hypothetical protein [Arsenophonus nasoniae]QBY43833.1 hypothetical protein ArsFIN_24020 [Arsenophonus nasoniae]WGM04176.1 hypothetical protein QE258_10930 [Arsenophonus nasoniae]WGM09278.1 hypothetical protein QE197_10205 [Arsenophonus nasoniae]WGM14000.1 hypothetical protein QE193_10095 [Arsenophonus nasoniae]